MRWLSGDSTVAYAFIDEWMAYLRNLGTVAGSVAVVNSVGTHPGKIFTMQAQTSATSGLAVLAVLLAVAAGTSAAHKMRLLVAKRWPEGWNAHRSEGVMAILVFLFAGSGIVFTVGVSKALTAVLVR